MSIPAMQSLEISSTIVNILRTIGIGLFVIAFSYFLMLVLGADSSGAESVPVVSLSLYAVGFALVTLLFVYEPSWLGVNVLSWFLIIAFALILALSSASSGVLSLLFIPAYYLLLQSQYSTDTRDLWVKAISEPSSWPITLLSVISVWQIAVGFRVGAKLRESFSQVYIFLLLLSAAVVGLCSGAILDSVFQIVGAISV